MITNAPSDNGSPVGSGGPQPETARQARFRALAEVSNSLIWVLSADGVVTEEQPALQAFTGRSFEKTKGAEWAQALHPDDYARVLEEWRGFLSARVPAQIEYRIRRHDGAYRWMRARAIPIFENDGSLREWAGANEDITDEREAHDALRLQKERLQQFADSLPHIAWEANAEGHVVWLNEQYRFYTGIDPVAALGWAWKEVLHPEDSENYLAAWKDAVARSIASDSEARIRRHDGAFRWFKFRAAPQRDANGRVFRWYGTATDINESRLNADRIQKFIATLGHELRNPLAPIRNGIRILKTGEASGEAGDNVLAMIDRQVEHMVRLIDDLLDIHRITTERLALRRELLSLESVVRDAIETSLPLLKDGKHPLHIDFPAAPCFVNADPTRLVQVFANLLNNAAKYSENEKAIWITATVERDSILVAIEDEGVGIPPAMAERIFEMFAQVEQGVGQTPSGLGIGLNVARRLAEMHEGTVQFQLPASGKGSRFTVKLPLANPEDHEKAPMQPTAPSEEAPVPRRVLIVDDNVDAAQSLVALVNIFGHEGQAAYSGLDALKLADELRPDIMFVDIGMPGMNGYEVASSIRKWPWGTGVKLIALTGWGQPGDRAASAKAGFDLHIVKPINGDLLREVLDGNRQPISSSP